MIDGNPNFADLSTVGLGRMPKLTNELVQLAHIETRLAIVLASQVEERESARATQPLDEVAHAAHHLLESLITKAPPRNRETEAVKARARSAQRYGLEPAANGHQ